VPGAATPAVVAVQRAGVEHRVLEYEHTGGEAYGPEAAEALGADPARMFKTLVATIDGALVVAVVPVLARLDLKALAAAAGAKRATMADPSEAERVTGYVVGGISPLGQRRRLRTFVDESAAGFATVLVSGGRRGLELELAPDDLVRLTGGTVAPLAT
jgi:Cys-tRNA(Pro)/Cys-tRNA(Cys) deacylase